MSLGFAMTGDVDPMFKEPIYALALKPLRM